jgi:hypothetical protein
MSEWGECCVASRRAASITSEPRLLGCRAKHGVVHGSYLRARLKGMDEAACLFSAAQAADEECQLPFRRIHAGTACIVASIELLEQGSCIRETAGRV